MNRILRMSLVALLVAVVTGWFYSPIVAATPYVHNPTLWINTNHDMTAVFKAGAPISYQGGR